ncbi:MAG: hypothetical protein AAF989_09020, partial [Planctomycetota bacterium]
GGRTWLSTRTMIGRVKFATKLIEGRLHRPAKPFDPESFARRHGAGSEEEQQALLNQLIMGQDAGSTSGESMATIVELLCSPEAQLG